MKITKFVHSCLLVEMPEPVNRTVLYDPGVMSEGSLEVDSLVYLDDIVITHKHPDHLSMPLLKQILVKFPDVRITTTPEVVGILAAEGIAAAAEAPEGMQLFTSPHEEVRPTFELPDNIGVHYLDLLTNPGDSHSFTESKAVLALPITAPWGATVTAVNLALELKPQFIVPIHDWHWSLEAQTQMYDSLETLFKDKGISFQKPVNGEPLVLDVSPKTT